MWTNRCRMRNYYTLAEMLLEGDDFLAKNNPFAFKGLSPEKGLYSLLNSIAGKTLGSDDQYTIKLLSDYIWPEMWNEYAYFIDGDPSDEEMEAARKAFAGLLWGKLEETKERYETLISLYSSNISDLMKQISSETTTLFCDTPQDGSDPFDEDFVTNAGKTSISEDGGTVISRLNEIRVKLRNMYVQWASEFRCFVLPGSPLP